MQDRLYRALHTTGEIFYGMTTFGWAHCLQRQRGELARLFFLVTFGDLLGLPFLPPYYTLRLIPYIVPHFHRWKRSLLRQQDWTDLAEVEGVN